MASMGRLAESGTIFNLQFMQIYLTLNFIYFKSITKQVIQLILIMLVETDVCVWMVFVWEETGVLGVNPPVLRSTKNMTRKDNQKLSAHFIKLVTVNSTETPELKA